MISLANSVRWTNGSPYIALSFSYEKQRSGADMKYRVQISVSPVTGGSYFGYPIYLGLTINGTFVGKVTLKESWVSQWSSAITYTSDWHTVPNKTSGTVPVAFNVYSDFGSTRNETYTYSMGVDPAASKVSASNGTLGEKLSISVTRYNAEFTHTITYKCGTASGTVCEKSSNTTVDWITTNGNTLALASQNTSGTSVNITFTITTYSSTTPIGNESTTISMGIPDTVIPSVALVVKDAEGYFDTYGAYVQGWSKLQITAIPTLAYNSPIAAYSIAADGKTYSISPVTTDVIQGKNELTVTAKVTDNRSRPSEEASVDITVLEYSKPSVSAIAYRCNSSGEEDPEGAYMRIGFSSTIASLNGVNSAHYMVKCGSHTFEGSGTEYLSDVLACDISRAWSVEVKVDDDLESSTKAAVIPIAFTLIDYYHTGYGVAFGKVATRDGFDCAMPAYFTGEVYIGDQSLADYIATIVRSL